jgi:hypothetical protein
VGDFPHTVFDGAVGDHGCLLVPTLRRWPHLIVKLDPELPPVVHFPAGDWEQHRQVPQPLVRERLAALAEPARLDPCRHLLGEPITTSELAERDRPDRAAGVPARPAAA